MMRMRMRFATLLLTAAAAAPLFAAPVADETFEGLTTSSVDSQGTGSGWSGTWTSSGGQSVVDTTGSSLSYTFTEGAVISGGDRALEFGGSDNTSLFSRQFASSVTSDDVYFSFLIKRTGGSSTGGSSFDDFGMFWLDSSTGGSHSGAPNVGVYDETGGGNQFLGRLTYPEDSSWAGFGGSSSTNTFLIVAHLSKGNNGSNPDDYDSWELWAFDAGAASRSITDLATPDSSGATATSVTSLSYLGMRTAINEADDRWTVDELRLGTQLADVAPTTFESNTANINGDHTITFSDYDAIPKTTVTGTDSIFADNGITNVSAVAANGTDVQNQSGKTGASLFANASEMFILKENTGAATFGETTSFTLDFARTHNAFGVSFQDQVGPQDFTIDLYRNGELVGSHTKSIGSTATTPFIIESIVEFDRAVVSGGASGDGWGIDNILLDAVRETDLSEFSGYTVVDFESVAAGPTGSATFVDGELTVTATGGGTSGDFESVGSSNGQGLYYNGSEFLIISAAAGTSGGYFGSNHVFTLDFNNAKNLIGLNLTDAGTGDFNFTFYLNGVLQADYLKTLTSTNNGNQTIYYATDFLFDRLVIDALASDGFGLDNITYQLVPEPTSLATLLLGGAMLVRRRTR